MKTPITVLLIADCVFTIAAIAAAVVGLVDRKYAVTLAIGGLIGAFLLRRAKANQEKKSAERRKERSIHISPTDWHLEHEDGVCVRAWLEVAPNTHGKGEDVNVRIEQTELKRWDLEEPKIERGRIFITYSPNNFPGRGISLNLYISGRG